MIAAITVTGWPRRLLAIATMAFGIASFVYWTGSFGSFEAGLVAVLWGMSPAIAMATTLALTTRRQLVETPKPPAIAPEPPEPPEPPTFNPAITATYLNEMVNGATDLEAKRRLTTLKNQTAQFKGQVLGISEGWKGDIDAEILGLQTRTPFYGNNKVRVYFDKSNAAALEALKRGEWIEFKGEIEFDPVFGWSVVRADFIGRADPPPAPKPPRKPRVSRQSSRAKEA